MNTKHKIAFHLARGKHFQHWQIKLNTGDVVYIDPAENSIILRGCVLKNRKSSSLRIFKGADKERCAWVEFESYDVVKSIDKVTSTQVRFNPRVSPTWMINNQSDKDDTTFDELFTNNRNIYK